MVKLFIGIIAGVIIMALFGWMGPKDQESQRLQRENADLKKEKSDLENRLNQTVTTLEAANSRLHSERPLAQPPKKFGSGASSKANRASE